MDDTTYNFPISINILNHLVGNVLDPDELSTELEDQKIISKNKFLSVLQTLLKVSKQRKSLMITVKIERCIYGITPIMMEATTLL